MDVTQVNHSYTWNKEHVGGKKRFNQLLEWKQCYINLSFSFVSTSKLLASPWLGLHRSSIILPLFFLPFSPKRASYIGDR